MSYDEIGALMMVFFLGVGCLIFSIGMLKKDSKRYQEVQEYRNKQLELLEKLVNKKEIE